MRQTHSKNDNGSQEKSNIDMFNHIVFRNTVLGPVYGSPIQKMVEINEHFVAFSLFDQVSMKNIQFTSHELPIFFIVPYIHFVCFQTHLKRMK